MMLAVDGCADFIFDFLLIFDYFLSERTMCKSSENQSSGGHDSSTILYAGTRDDRKMVLVATYLAPYLTHCILSTE